MSLAIGQGDYVYYTDTSTGDPTGWNWYFVGGSPTGSNSQNPIIQYLSPSPYVGFSTTLNINKGLLTASVTENGAIFVAPETLYLEVNAFPDADSIDMSTSVDYQITTVPPSQISYYRWVLPGATGFSGGSGTGFTGPPTTLSQNVDVDDWFNVSGYYGGATYSTSTSFATVYVYSVLGNVDANNVQVTFNKNGPPETTNFADASIYDPINAYYVASITPYLTPVAGLPGGGPVLSINPAGFLNSKFRGHGEFVYYSTSNMDVSITLPASYGLLELMYVASGAGLNNMAVPYSGWEVLPRYTAGDYMLAGDVSTYFSDTAYLGDAIGNLRKLTLPPRYWTNDQIASIVFETAVASQTSKNLEMLNGYLPIATIFGEDGYNGASGGKGGCCLPSHNICGTRVSITLNLYYSGDGSMQAIDPGLTTSIPVVISDPGINGGNGNSPDSRIVLAQDTTAGNGIASLIQAELDNYFINVLGHPANDFVIAEASPDYAYQAANPNYDIDVFNGLKITILKNDPLNAGTPPYLVKIGLEDNFLTNPNMPNPYNKTVAFGTASIYQGNWTCFGQDFISNPAQEYNQMLPVPYRGFTYGQVPY